ncbi:MAG TPA: CopG family transcriptional regulator [Candidatus Aenigmarchaeota archaeon]|nr:CopG family transcriptional regulator [Candidatus Aenigmarchaeota archaeon]
MTRISLNPKTIEKLNKIKKEGESFDEVIEKLIETYEELSDYIEEKWSKLQRDKKKFINLDDYTAQKGL